MTTAILVAFEKSLTKLCKYMFKHPEFENHPSHTNNILSKIIPKESKKIIIKARLLRNALIHYDFTTLLGKETCGNHDAETILNLATVSTVKMTSSDYLNWLRDASKEIATNTANIVNLPR